VLRVPIPRHMRLDGRNLKAYFDWYKHEVDKCPNYGKKIKPRLDQSSPAIVRELSKCILCGRCVRVCEEIITSTSLDFINCLIITCIQIYILINNAIYMLST
jgi:predicted molibdopterin-dependent oxidoreductase YjgC